MAYRKTFKLSDESVNSHGFWCRTAGARLSAFQNNAPLYYSHRTWELPVGHVENIRVENGAIMGDVVIDGGDQREKDYIRKIEAGDIKGVSLGIDPIKWSEEPMFLKDGQTAPTLWEWEPYELSLEPIPSNKAALALRKNNSVITLSADAPSDFIPSLKSQKNMKAIALKLGLTADATEQEILNAISGVQLSASNAEDMRKHIVELGKNDLETEEKKALFEDLVKTNFNQAVKFLQLSKAPSGSPTGGEKAPTGGEKAPAAAPVTKVSDLIKKGEKPVELSKDDKTCYDYLQKKDPVELARIHKEEPEKYAQLAKDYEAGKRYTGN